MVSNPRHIPGCTQRCTWFQDPELVDMPAYGRTESLDAENSQALVARHLDGIDVQHWDAPLVHLPDCAAIARIATPLDLTKRGMLLLARKSRSEARYLSP